MKTLNKESREALKKAADILTKVGLFIQLPIKLSCNNESCNCIGQAFSPLLVNYHIDLLINVSEDLIEDLK